MRKQITLIVSLICFGSFHADQPQRIVGGSLSELMSGSNNEIVWAVKAEANPDGRYRGRMEDRFLVDEMANIVGVVDGHGGQSAAQYVVEPITADKTPRFSSLCNQFTMTHGSDGHRLTTALSKIEDELWKNKSMQHPNYLYCGKPELCGNTGTTAIVGKLSGTTFTLANVGDSRALLIRNGSVIDRTHDHKPNDELERKRIEKFGGSVLVRHALVNGRAEQYSHVVSSVGLLGMSRGIGDVHFKESFGAGAKDVVTATPDIYSWPVRSGDSILLASDGLWDCFEEKEVAKQVASYNLKDANQAQEAVQKLVAKALVFWKSQWPGQGDNITALIVTIK